jgi:FkbM family methyltransferase
MMRNQHHPIFFNFERFTGNAGGHYYVDFLGTITRRSFLTLLDSDEVSGAPDYPEFSEEYFEWIDVLESVMLAGSEYTMIELGAGYGRWAVRAAFAARQKKKNFRLLTVEAEPLHFEWISTHFRDNGLDPAAHAVFHAAVADRPGYVSFYVESPLVESSVIWYGQSIVQADAVVEEVEDRQHMGLQKKRHQTGSVSVVVQSITLDSILAQCKIVDLIDMDIQGQEAAVISSAVGSLDQKVKRLHVGTHSPAVDQQLKTILGEHGWLCHADYGWNSVCETPWGRITFEDGVQGWTNPRLHTVP